MRLRDRLKELRRARSYSLRELRDRIEDRAGERMAISYLSELERLETTPSVEVLSRIAKGYDMTLQDLIDPVQFEDNPAPPVYPPSLIAYQKEYNVDDDDIAALARLEYRGHQPTTPEGWRVLHSAFAMFQKEKER